MNSSPSEPPESSDTPLNESLSREDYLALAKVCRNIDNRDIDMHPGKDNRENYPDSPENWANEIEMTREEEDKLIEIYRWRIDNDLLSWDPVKASHVRIREAHENEAKAPPKQTLQVTTNYPDKSVADTELETVKQVGDNFIDSKTPAIPLPLADTECMIRQIMAIGGWPYIGDLYDKNGLPRKRHSKSGGQGEPESSISAPEQEKPNDDNRHPL